jgi:hypothetical protein
MAALEDQPSVLNTRSLQFLASGDVLPPISLTIAEMAAIERAAQPLPFGRFRYRISSTAT